MPVAPVTTSPAGAAPVGTGAAPAAPSPGFAAALDRALAPGPRPAAAAPVAQTVTLGEMVGSTPIVTAPSLPATSALPGLAAAPRALPATGDGAHVLAAAEQYLGVSYRWGGTDPATGLDCSGFVQRVYADLGVSLPRVSADQARAGTPVPSLADARPGDLVYWDGSPNHIGIYAGGNRMIVSPHTGANVRYQDLPRTPDAIRRVL